MAKGKYYILFINIIRSYANVYSAINKAEGKNVAIKLYDIFKLAGPNRMMSVKREI